MKKQFTLLNLVIMLATGTLSAQTYLPVITTNYTLDAIAESSPANGSTNGTLDGSNYVMYSTAYGTAVGSSYGLPSNGTINSGTKTYQLQDYSGPNVLMILSLGTDSLIFPTPQPYPSVSILCFATEGQGSLDVRVRFTDNTTQTFTGLTIDDWFGNTTTPIISGFDRTNRGSNTPDFNNQGSYPEMYSLDLNITCSNQNKSIQTISFINNSVGARICVTAASAVMPSYGATSSTLAVCAGGTVSIVGNGLNTYSWQPAGPFAGSNSASIVVSPSVTTTYTLDGDVTATTCPGRTLVTINSSSNNPVISLAGTSSSVCLGAAATITASGAYSYTLSNGAANGGTFTPGATADYTVTAQNGCGTSSAVTTVSVAPLPVGVSSSTNTVCAGSGATLTGSGATTYSWLPGTATGTNYLAITNSNSTYTVLGQTGNCIGSNTIAISTIPYPTMTITGASSVCKGESITLNVSGNAVSYTWAANGQSGTSITDSPLSTTVYNVSGIGANGCYGSAQQIVTAVNNPTIHTSPASAVICAGTSQSITASGAASYSWSTSDLTAGVSVSPGSDITYTVVGTSSLGCSSSTMVTVSVLQPTVGIISDLPAVCIGGQVNITASGADTYVWSSGANFPSISITPNQTAVYTVTGTATDANTGLSCDATNTIQISVYPNPTITASANNSIICQGASAILTGSGAGATGTYTWTGGPSPVNNSTVNVSPIATQNYTVTGTDQNGCKSKTAISITVKICVGIASISADKTDLIIYPNPSSGEFVISTDEAMDLVIINDLGQAVKTLKLDSRNENKVSITDLAAGIYFVQSLNSDKPVVKKKIMIVK